MAIERKRVPLPRARTPGSRSLGCPAAEGEGRMGEGGGQWGGGGGGRGGVLPGTGPCWSG